jgi:multisubunit Na+/H+ antiporter MnhB subunit
VQLSAIDVAMTEAAIGAGLTGGLLIGAASRLRKTDASAEPPGVVTHLLAATVAIGVAAAIAACVVVLPDPGPTLVPDVTANLAATAVGNPVTAVLMSFRAMDTLLEAIVLALALMGVWSIGPDRAWGGRPGPVHEPDPHGMLAYAARTLPALGVVVAIYIFWVGADEPGGKFQGATILAALWLLVTMAALADVPAVSSRSLRIGVAVGPLVFVGIGGVGAVVAGAFLAYPDGLAKPLIIAIEVALLPSLALTLALLLIGPPKRRVGP